MSTKNYIAIFAFLVSVSQLVSATTPSGDGIACSTASSTEFTPSTGLVYIGGTGSDKFVIQKLYWHNDDRLKWFKANSDSTYEPDVWFDGSGSGNPEKGTSSTAFGYFPRTVFYNHGDYDYWESDLPSPYQDTAFGDTGDEWATTVGSANASAIKSGQVYYTATFVWDGGADSGDVKLQSQRGRRAYPTTPWFVEPYSTWNSYSCNSSSNNVKTLPWGYFSAPGCQIWWYKWDISATKPCQ